MKIRLRGKLKGFFFSLNLHTLVPAKIFSFAGHLSALSRWIRKHRKIAFTDYYSFGFNYQKRYDLYTHVINSEKLEDHFDYLEFGVAQGFSFRWWAEHIKGPDVRFYGFDTFSGLPEDWGPFRKGDMSNNNDPPVINDPRCSFYQGLFQQTLPDFLKNKHLQKRKVIHMDADLYSATLYVLTSIFPYLNKGDIILFDEFNVPLHEFKAFTDWVNSFYIDYEVLGAVNNFYQIALKIK